jgi:hypothetical protein
MHKRYYEVKMNFAKLTAVALLTLTVQLAFSADKGLGCGLGSEIAPDKTWISATTQGSVDYFFPVSSSITSGTSGCADHSIVKKNKEAIHYAEANYQQLELEISQGKGEFLVGFTQVLGCNNKVNVKVNQALQAHYEQLFPEQGNAGQMLRDVQTLIKSEPALNSSCSVNFVI